MKLSVNICTWNRANELCKTLQSLTLLEIPNDVVWELLIVNNNCSDDTDIVIQQYLEKLPIVHLHEPTPGKSHALNLAIKHATGEVIIFTDDDVLVSKTWLTNYAAAASNFPEYCVFGGCVTPLYEKKPPKWVEENLQDLQDVFALRPVDQPTHECNNEIPFVGANMAIRTNAFAKREFNTRLGRAGANNVRGEETQFLHELLTAGKKFLWVEEVNVQHLVSSSRMTKKYVWDWYFGIGRAHAIRSAFPVVSHWWQVPKWLYRAYIETALKVLFRLGRRDHHWLINYKQLAKLRGIIFQLLS